MKNRLVIAILVLAAWTGAVVARLYELQVTEHEEYVQRARNQQHRRVELEPPRGTLYDARGREMAISVEVESVWADPSRIEDVDGTAEQLARILRRDRRAMARSLASEREFVWIGRLLDPPVSAAVRELRLDGIYFLKESRRYYPLGQRAAQMIGFAGIDNEGLEGLEKTYDDRVAGRPAERKVVRDARRGTVLSPSLSFRDPEPGSDLHLTVDATIQHLLERELGSAVAKSGAKGGHGVVLDPNTGAVLAMASLPAYDPNRFGAYPAWRRKVRALTDPFEPGSTFKIITAAAALEAGLVDPEDVFDCERGGITLAGVRIRDHHPFDELTFSEIIAKSSNVGAIKIGLMVGRRDLYRMIREFGFGRRTGIDLPAESPGQLSDVEDWPKRAAAYISFGQGLSVTALQLTNAVAAVANGGTLYRPFVVAGWGDTPPPAGGGPEGGVRVPASRVEVLGRPISRSTAVTLQRMLEGVVTDGTGRKAAIPGYRVAGKTGTAQKAFPGIGYSPDRFMASFVGFAPVERPALVAVVVIDEPDPTRGYHGGDVAAPVFSAVIGPSLLYLGVPPSREAPELWPGQREPEAEGKALLAEVGTAGEPPPGEQAAEVAPAGALPDLSGLTARQAVVETAALGLRVRLEGRGFVARQDPAPGTPLGSTGEVVELWLAEGAGS